MSTFFNATPARQRLAIKQSHETHATISFNPPAMEDAERAPLDLAVAMDTSGSMRGDKIENAKRSLLKLVEHLTERDRLSLVIFSSGVSTVIHPTLMTTESKREAIDKIKRLEATSMTNLSGGLIKALDHLKSRGPEEGKVRRCLLFTDGLPTAGERNHEALVGIAMEMRSNIGISTFGYGTDHDPDLLSALALDGNFHYINTPEKILSAFGVELGGLISTFAQNVTVTLEPSDGIEIIEVMNDVTVTKDGDKVIVEYDDLLAEQEQHIVLKLKIDERENAHPRGIKLVKASVSYFDVAAKKTCTDTCTLKARFVKPDKADTEDDKKVMAEVVLQNSARAHEAAIRAAEAGDFVGSRAVLAKAASDADAMGFADFGGLHRELARSYASPQSYAANRGSTRAVTRGLKKRKRVVGADVEGVALNEAFGNSAQAAAEAAFMDGDNEDSSASALTPSDTSDSVSKVRSDRW